ncbi:MAG: Uma2 family endonuclease [Bernardetiaceae bacterium]|nr:Uma2 family endonuclease [Bernardetiaceae bacterium]
MITNLAELDLNGVYTYADYLRWQFTERVELIKGRLFKMSPGPSKRHQEVSLSLSVIFVQHIRQSGSGCGVYTAPFDVRLVQKKAVKSDQDIHTVVQPDLFIVCDRAKLDERGCLGAPDLVVEILSRGNSSLELKNKYALYEENGVREYWVVFPYEEVLQQFVLDDNGQFRLHQVHTQGSFASYIFPDLEVAHAAVFAE